MTVLELHLRHSLTDIQACCTAANLRSLSRSAGARKD